MIQRVVTGSSRLRKYVPMGTPISAPNTMTAVALRSACFHAGVLPRVRYQRRRRDEIDDEQKRCDQARRRHAACERHEDQRRAEAGKSARGSRYEGNRADGDCGIDADLRRDQVRQDHPRNTPPVLFVTSATILAATASIS